MCWFIRKGIPCPCTDIPVRYRNHTELQIRYDTKPPSTSLRTITSILSSNGTPPIIKHSRASKNKRHFPMPRLIFEMFFLFFIVTACAHKAPPLSKDRLSPKLQEISALSNRQIQFTFSEQLDTLNLKPEFFSITTTEDTLTILFIYPSLSAAEIIAFTDYQSAIQYEVSGYVFDTAQNKGTFRGTFLGTSQPDTIPPWIVSYAKGANKKNFFVEFSEAMDTTYMKFYTLPKKNLVTRWKNYRTCRFIPETPADSFKQDTTYYLFLNRGARDVSKNTIDMFATNITPDTLYEPIFLQGNVKINDTSLKTGVAIIKKEYPIGIALVEQGRFAFEVRDSAVYTVEVLSGDYSGSGEISVDSISTIFLKKGRKEIDNFFN